MMLRTRAVIGRIYRKQGLLINSFYVLRQSLTNYKLFAEGWTNETESGQEDKSKGSFELPDSFATGGSTAPPAKGGKAPPPAKKGADPKGKNAAVDSAQADAQERAEEEFKQKKLASEREMERLRVEAINRRQHSNMYLWLKTKLEVIGILFGQRRFEDCSDCITVTKLECMSIRDQFFTR